MIKKRGRGRPKKPQNVTFVPSIIDFKDIVKLNKLNIDPKMLEQMNSGLTNIDKFISHETGIPRSTNIMACGDPGVGKTTILLDVMSGVVNNGYKGLFISGEMGKKQMHKYTKRFPQFGNIETLFISDYLEYNTKNVVEQVLDKGWDIVLIDSIAEIIDGARDDNNWERKFAESWLVDVCNKHNKGENKSNSYTAFLLIQQVTKSGVFVGGNKLKHLTDAMLEMRRERNGGAYMEFTKNRNGECGYKMGFDLNSGTIKYGAVSERDELTLEITNQDEVEE